MLAADDRDEERRLFRLDELDEYEVADDDPDVRGWAVLDSTGRRVGLVGTLIVDPNALKVRYLEVHLDRDLLPDGQDLHVLVPIGLAELDEHHDSVVLPSIHADRLFDLPPYTGEPVTRDFEQALRRALAAAPSGDQRGFYEHEHFDNRRLYDRREAREGVRTSG